MTTMKSLPVEESLLFHKLFPSRSSLQAHLAEYLKDEGSRISVIQFDGHLPRIEVVSEELRLLSWITAFEKGKTFRESNPVRMVSIHEQDWFLETLSAGAAAIAIYEFIVKRLKGKFPTRNEKVKERVRRTRTKYRTVVRQVTRTVGAQQFAQQIPQQVPYEEEYFEEVERVKEVTVKSVSGVEITEVDRVIHRIRRLEIYDNLGKVSAARFEVDE